MPEINSLILHVSNVLSIYECTFFCAAVHRKMCIGKQQGKGTNVGCRVSREEELGYMKERKKREKRKMGVCYQETIKNSIKLTS
jgi:hypothetical protein